ncbi:MAG: hypothetical protein WC856_00070 [Methylococcaceae bacterium]
MTSINFSYAVNNQTESCDEYLDFLHSLSKNGWTYTLCASKEGERVYQGRRVCGLPLSSTTLPNPKNKVHTITTEDKELLRQTDECQNGRTGIKRHLQQTKSHC